MHYYSILDEAASFLSSELLEQTLEWGPYFCAWCPYSYLHTEACAVCESDVRLLLKNLQWHLTLLRVKTNTKP